MFRRTSLRCVLSTIIVLAVIASCAPAATPISAPTAVSTAASTPSPALNVLAAETFLADMAQNVAGNRLKVSSLMPVGVDPHGFAPTPADVKKVADSQVLIVNGAGVEEFLDELLKNAGGQRTVIEASAGLPSREAKEGEKADHEHHEGDPHFWLDPILVIKYVENIRDGLSQADPDGAKIYAANAEAYIKQLQDLDKWIVEQVKQVPDKNRQLVTNHESLGYFADRYGFKIVGAIIPSVSTGASPSAKELAQLAAQVKQAGVKAIFLETGANPQLARQLAQEVGIQVVTELYTHSITDAKGVAPTYLDMMRYNVRAIVDALK